MEFDILDQIPGPFSFKYLSEATGVRFTDPNGPDDQKILCISVGSCGKCRCQGSCSYPGFCPGGLQEWMASEDVRRDPGIVLAAVNRNGNAFQYADAELQSDADLVEEAAERDCGLH